MTNRLLMPSPRRDSLRPMPRRLIALGLLVLACQQAWAAPAEQPELPPSAVVRTLL
ncbi:MAG: hypothetical protein JSS47_00880, partial [Proteobacteria bacterium]|nr:hypothetical protein [Pseudomonadota bacterium]